MFVDAQDEDGDNPGGVETNDRAGEAAVTHTGIQQRTTNGITDGGGADQQPFDPADDMVIDGESIHVGHDPMDKSAPDANRGAGEAASMEQETNAQTMKDMAERDKFMQDTAAAIRREAMEATEDTAERVRRKQKTIKSYPGGGGCRGSAGRR